MFPYFLKSEDNQDKEYLLNGYHARGGYLTVSQLKFLTPIGQAFIRAAQYIGYPVVDVNGPYQSGFTVPQGTIRNGARCSAAKAFLKPVQHRSNLHLLTFSFVTRILFNEQKRAVAVQFDRFTLSHLVYARKEIIISAGSINSPQLLMLSGLGPASHLETLGVSCNYYVAYFCLFIFSHRFQSFQIFQLVLIFRIIYILVAFILLSLNQ